MGDITDEVVEKYKDGERTFLPSNDSWGDLEPNVVKTLRIKYKLAGEFVLA